MSLHNVMRAAGVDREVRTCADAARPIKTKATSNAKHPDLGDSEADLLAFRDLHSGVANLLSGGRLNFRDDIRNLHARLIRAASRTLRVMRMLFAEDRFGCAVSLN